MVLSLKICNSFISGWGMTSPSGIAKTIEELGTEITLCRETCEGVKRLQGEGYYPRVFFLEPEGSPRVNVVIVGENPGNCGRLEREFYKALAERREDKIATFEDCQRVWRSIAEHEYFQRPKHLLKELFGKEVNGILWAEVAFCEKFDPAKKIPKETFEKCSDRFLVKILELLPGGGHVLCLGRTAFKYAKRLQKQNQWEDRWKVIRTYHPTGARAFANYFEEGKGKKVIERRLQEDIKTKFRKLESSQKSYMWKLKPPPKRRREQCRK